MVRWLAVHGTVVLHAIVLTIAIALMSQLRPGQSAFRLSLNRRSGFQLPPALPTQDSASPEIGIVETGR